MLRPLSIVTVALAMLACMGVVYAQGGHEEEIVLESEWDYEAAAFSIDETEMADLMNDLTGLGSRVTGYPGNEQAARLIEDGFRKLGLEVRTEEFPVVVPVAEPDAHGWPASITADNTGRSFKLLPIWPNLVRTPQTPPGGISGNLIYAHSGTLRSFNGLEVADSITMVDFNCEADWFNGPLLGTKAVLFIEPNETIRGEAEQKFLSIPVDIPRFWIPKETADYFLGLLHSVDQVPITVQCDMKWKRVTGRNIIAKLPGSDPRLARQQVVIQAYYDSISVTPDQAPGAENSCSIAALMQMAKVLTRQRPKRTVVFLATSGHFQALAGTKAFIREYIRGAKGERRVKHMFRLVDDSRAELEEAITRVWEEDKRADADKSEEEIINERMRALGRIYKAVRFADKRSRGLTKTIAVAKREDPNRGKLYERQLSADELAERMRLIGEFERAVPEISSAIDDAYRIIREARRLPRDASLDEKKQALARVEEASWALVEALDFSPEKIYLWFSVDLSSHNRTFGIFYKAYFYNCRESIQWKFSDIGKKAREYASLISDALGTGNMLVDGINAIQGKSWRTYMAGKLALSNEVATLAGIPGLGFATIDDSRPWVDTPMDIMQHVDMSNLVDQTTFLACLMMDMVSLDEPSDIYDLELSDDFVEIKGRAVEFNPGRSLFPDEPMVGAIAVARTGTKTSMGVRSEIFDIVDENGRFYLPGLANTRARWGTVTVEAYMLDPDTGAVKMAPDLGVTGAEAYPNKLTMDQDIKPATIVLFDCKPVAIFDMVDQRFFQLLREIHVYDAATDAVPYEYGYCLPLPPQQFTSSYEPVAVVFAPSGTKVKITMGASLLGLRFLLVNPTKREELGEGYLVDRYPSLYATPYRVAVDMWTLDDTRMADLAKHGITNQRVVKAHERAREYLDQAEEQLAARRYDRFFTDARSAWSFESRAYPDVRKTADDVVKGVLFYLALLMPFAYFAERLFLGGREIKRQIIGVVAFFVGIFILIALVHPAFAITFTPMIILLAFIILALTIIVVGIIVQKFEEQMKEVRFEQTGLREADVSRLGASAAAFSLGISNMRRRKVRTLLTCSTLVLLTFTVLSCTSVKQTMRANRIKLPKSAKYNGIMIRDKTWTPIGEPTQRVMDNEFGANLPVAPRAWYFSARVGEQSFVTISRAGATYAATALVGMTPAEARITAPQNTLLEGGRWFTKDDQLACIVPVEMAEKLNISPTDVGNVWVSVFGTRLRVIGIIDSDKFKKIEDLDGEPITPVDYLLMQEQQAQRQAMQAGEEEMSEDELREYIHLTPDAVLIVPYDFVINGGGTLRSVAIAMKDADQVRDNLENLMSRIELNLYAGIDGTTYLCSAVGTTGFQGAGDVAIPILLAALIVLNTMLGSVYERVNEIHIYSSLGLAPTHIAALFVAEASVYAVLGAVAGYLVGQAAARILLATGMMSGLYLNYSSLAAVGSTLIIMVTVLLSVIYPARKASDIAMPGIERRWTLPEPEDDHIRMDLPFTVTGDQALGVNVFLMDYLGAHADYSLGNFSTGDLVLSEVEYELGTGYSLGVMVWLAPYDLGVSEHMTLETVPTEDAEIFQIRTVIRRESGDEASWLRVTRNFINLLRKQYLLWRTLPVSQKGDYGARGRRILAGEEAPFEAE
ncbi:MAG: M28 family peptidase [Armatimonadetes bacterium]|nr:M28 family peptidase [Armatimonadota bacterium]